MNKIRLTLWFAVSPTDKKCYKLHENACEHVSHVVEKIPDKCEETNLL